MSESKINAAGLSPWPADDKDRCAEADRMLGLPPNVITYPLSALRGMDEEPAPAPSGPWCENCGDAFDGPERPCPHPAPGEPLKQCGRGGHMFRLKRPPVMLRAGDTWTGPDGTVYEVVQPEEVGDRPRWWISGCDQEAHLPHDPAELHDDALDDSCMGPSLALVLSTGQPSAAPDLKAEIASARAALSAETAEHVACAEDLRRANASIDALSDRLYITAHALGANLPAPADRYAEDAALRIELGVADLQRAHATLERSRGRWQARARKAEARVAVLTQERDGLTLRLGAKVAREVRGPRERTARPKRQIGKEKASTRKNRRERNTRKGGR